MRHVLNSIVVFTAASLGLMFSASPLSAQEVPGCGNLKNGFGPYDYRSPFTRDASRADSPLQLVEMAHFTKDVESLRRGSSGSVIGDIDYTLRAIPNHPRALNSIARYALQGGRFVNPSIPSADCYFQRAVQFTPDDETVRMLYANYLVKRGVYDEAERQYSEALRLAPNSAEVNYNAGLFFLNRGDLGRAKELANVAYANGYPLPGLGNKIKEAESKRN